MIIRFLAFALVLLATDIAAAAEKLRLGALKFGTVNWELTTIRDRGFDRAEGFELDIAGYASSSAAKVAFLAGDLDAFVSDWIWVARQRAAGKDLVFIPYSKAVGGLMAPADGAAGIADLKGAKIGIAGGPLDKSWLILRAYAAQAHGFDLKAETEQVYGAPPLIFQTALQGQTAGAINFWHFLAKMEAKGFKPVITVSEAAAALDLDPETPLLGYVVTGETARQRPELVAGLAAASRAAKDLLATDDAAWEELRPLMKPASEAEFAALVAGFRAGIPQDAPIDEAAAAKFFDVMVRYGGDDLVGGATALPDGVFWSGGG